MLSIPKSTLSILIFLFSFLLTCFYRKFAVKRSVLDIPCERSSHETPTPRGGGIAIVISFYLCLSYIYIKGELDKALFFSLLPGLVLALTGFIDDIKNLSAPIRFTVQFICAGIALYFLGGFKGFFLENLSLLWTIMALIGFVWFINLFNFLDGSDGYASMESISIALALWYFSGINIMVILALAVGGFLYWNLPKAKIFMGDVGSTTLGFILVVSGIYLHNKVYLSFNFWMIITALFWFDATITLFRRIKNKEKLSLAHRSHIYQKAIQGGFSHLKVMLFGLGINFLLFAICYLIRKNYCPYAVGLILALLLLWFVKQYIDKKLAFIKQDKGL